MLKLKRTHNCGELRVEDSGKVVILNGWVESRRDHGNLIFVDIRDRYGKTQTIFSPDRNKIAYEIANSLGQEYVIAIKGIVKKRQDSAINKNLPTGEIEIEVQEIEVLNNAETPPFEIVDDINVSSEVRLKYRYLDLRRRIIQKIFLDHHRIIQVIREYFDKQGFIEIETPYMIKSTPGGARNFLIPSRIFLKHFFALAESPQIFKQLFMISGFDKYFQIARCFRDEDLRADRQLEFTQLDMEMSFVDEVDIMKVIEGCMAKIFQKALNIKIDLPFPKIPYKIAMRDYGTDKPDIRFEWKLIDITELARASTFNIFSECTNKGSIVKGINAEGCSNFSRKEIDELCTLVQGLGAKGLVWFKVEGNKLSSPTAKFLNDQEYRWVIRDMEAKSGDLLLFVADEESITNTALSSLRNYLCEKLRLVKKDTYKFCWVTDFPLFDWDEKEKRLVAMHHPFTSPKDEDLAFLEEKPREVKARAYDLVLNGVELGGGSIRIHRRNIQQRVFRLLSISDEVAKDKFGFLLEAFKYGTPPHGGIAIGTDRLVRLILGLDGIQDVIAFPKTQKTVCLLTGAPSPVDEKQLKELHIKCET